MLADRLAKFPTRILGSVHEFAVSVEREFRINREDPVAAAHDCINNRAGGSKSELRFVSTARQCVCKNAIEGPFAQGAARLRSAQYRLERLRRLHQIASDLLHFSQLAADLANRLAGCLELLRHGNLGVA